MSPAARSRLMELSEVIAHWKEHGFVILPGYVSLNELAPAQREIGMLFPTAQEFHDGIDEPRNAKYRVDEFAGITNFPFASVELSLLAVHPRVVRAQPPPKALKPVRHHESPPIASMASAISAARSGTPRMRL